LNLVQLDHLPEENRDTDNRKVLRTLRPQYKLADCNASSATAAVVGVAVTPGVDTGYGYIATSGSIVLVGTTMAVGSSYYVGGTAGTHIPEADLATNDYVSRTLTASSATQAILSIEATGVQHA